jgi:hypothetical protein
MYMAPTCEEHSPCLQYLIGIVQVMCYLLRMPCVRTFEIRAGVKGSSIPSTNFAKGRVELNPLLLSYGTWTSVPV